MIAGAVIGRDAELNFVEAFLEELGGGPAALVLSGEAGIGKTILWQVGVEEAQARFRSVLTCRGVEAEAALSFAGLSELLGGVLAGTTGSLSAPRRKALEVALLLAEPGEAPPDPLAIGLAVHDLLCSLARAGPLLVAIDDVQWLDPASMSVLEIALRRVRQDRIGLLVTARRARDVATPLGLERSLPEQRLAVLSVGPLSLGALHHLLRERLGLELSRSELARVQEASGGNSYFALELGRELLRSPSSAMAGRSLRVPESLRKATITSRRANDILRAAGLVPASLDDPGVMKDLIKAIEGTPLSPVLVVSDGASADIADGYHRVSLAYRIDPYTEIPLKLA